MADKPVTREEKYLAYLTGDYTGEIPKPITRKEQYLYELCLKGIGGEISPEEIKNAVNEYLEKNPVKPGATTEQAQQIEQNKTNIASLKEDLSNKITKFYASNQGETHLADSDNGKIMDMMLYGKSEQKQYSGKNLINSDEYYSEYKQSDGTYKGIANDFNAISVPISKYIGTQITVSCKVIVPSDTSIVLIEATINGTVTKGSRIESSKSGVTAITITPKTESDTIRITYGTGGSGIIVVSEFQIEKGSEVTSYEPYVGGQPSPSPDYPQEIKSVVNPTVKVYGENFYSGSDLIGLTGEYTTDFIPVILHNGKIRISFDTFSDTSDGKYHIIVMYFDANKVGIGHNGDANKVGNNISSVKIEFDGRNVGNNKVLDLKNVIYIKITFGIHDNTATEITYKNIMISATTSVFEPFKPIQTVSLPYTLNAVPVSSGGNVTINGQQYISDYVDVEKGKLYRKVKRLNLKDVDTTKIAHGFHSNGNGYLTIHAKNMNKEHRPISNQYKGSEWTNRIGYVYIPNSESIVFVDDRFTDKQTAIKLIQDTYVIYTLFSQTEEDLSLEQIKSLKSLSTYYPTTNISVNSEQLDGYTVFNYPISMANGWNYVKKQLNDNRDYIYDMDMQSAEAYVNSEYAVALTELEV